MVENNVEIPKKEEIISWIMAICDKGYRRPGLPASHDVEDLLIDELKSFGFETVKKQTFDIPLWEPKKWQFKYKSGDKIHQIPCFYACYTTFTDSNGVSGDLVYLGKGSDDDFAGKDLRGKIAIIDLEFDMIDFRLLTQVAHYVHNPNNENPEEHNTTDMARSLNWSAYHQAAKQGAVGFVGILINYPVDSPIIYHPAEGIEDLPRPIPGIFLGKGDGKKLKERLKDSKEASMEGAIILTGKESTGKTSNVFGILPGKSDEIMLLGSHHDAAFNNAVQDASGVSVILALAKYFAQIPKEKRNRTILVLFSTCHFYGSIGGYKFKEKYEDLVSRIVASVHVEHIALEGAVKDNTIVTTGLPQVRGFFVSGIPELQEIAKKAVIDHNLELTGIMPIITPEKESQGSPSKYSEGITLWTDATPFNDEGIAVLSIISSPFYLFHPLDTLDKVAVDQLEPVTSAFIDMIKKIDILPRDKLRK